MNGKASHENVQALAYQLWQERGGQGGSPEDDWHRAEQMLAEQEQSAMPDGEKVAAQIDHAVEESFPASDPPAVSVSDEPPVNAGAKWKAARGAGKRSGNSSARVPH
jgi:hypothetical protein